MATETSTVAVTRPADTGLKRELGLIGATWASETSIIGSGWLFGALFAAQAVGGAAVLAWAIAGVVVIVLALAYAELGAMYPVAAARPGSRTSRSAAWPASPSASSASCSR